MYWVAANNSVELRCCLLKGRNAHSEKTQVAGLLGTVASSGVSQPEWNQPPCCPTGLNLK